MEYKVGDYIINTSDNSIAIITNIGKYYTYRYINREYHGNKEYANTIKVIKRFFRPATKAEVLLYS